MDLNQTNGHIADYVIDTIENQAIGVCSTRLELGSSPGHVQLEARVAKFMGVESAITFGMGFATNSTVLPMLMDKRTLVLSDERNHCSIIHGCKLSSAKVRVFKHNDHRDLETKLIDAIQTRHRWSKIIIIVEGVYSMEGTICPIRELIALKKRYKAYLYLDEAHSIGALGDRGRGVCDFAGVSTGDVDLLMGTFTKSFGAAGGYIAGSKPLIDHIRRSSFAQYYATSMAPPVVAQVTAAFEYIDSKNGRDLIRNLKLNTEFFRNELIKRDFLILGHRKSPVVPMMLYHIPKVPFVNRELHERGVAVSVVGFPATEITETRARFCLSAGHTRDQLERAIEIIDEVGGKAAIKYERKLLSW